jgi:hypothetical protein
MGLDLEPGLLAGRELGRTLHLAKALLRLAFLASFWSLYGPQFCLMTHIESLVEGV